MSKRSNSALSKTNTQSANSKAVIDFYFPEKNRTKFQDKDGKNKTTYKCVCGKSERTLVDKTGFQNLMSHIEIQHPNYQEEIETFTKVSYTKALIHFCHLHTLTYCRHKFGLRLSPRKK